MAITVKHGGNAAPTIAAAYGGGMGKRRAEDTRQAAATMSAEKQANARLAAAKREAEINRKQRADEAETARKFSESQNIANRDWRSSEAELSRTGKQSDMILGTDLRLGVGEAEQERARADEEFAYTTQQRRELERLSDSEAAINADITLTDSERADALGQLEAQRLGIKQVRTLKKPTAQEQFEARKITFPDGTEGWLDSKGDPQVLDSKKEEGEAPVEMSLKDLAGLYKMGQDATRETIAGVTTEGTPAQVEAWVKNLIKLQESLNGKKQEPAVADPDAEGGDKSKLTADHWLVGI